MSKKNKKVENEAKKIEQKDEKSFDKAIDELLEKDDKGNETEEEIDKIKSDDEKTFDEIMNEILGVNDKNSKTNKEEFEEKIAEVSCPCIVPEPSNCIEEIENTQKYKFSDDARIRLFNGFILDTGFGEGYRERTLIQTSDHLEVLGSFNTRELIIEKHPIREKYGQVEFNDKQKIDSLIIENVGIFGSFDVAVVSIHDSSYVDIKLDITDKSKCTYLLLDTRFDRVRGRINMSNDFYSQLNAKNIDFLIEINKSEVIKILVDDIPIEDYFANYDFDDNLNMKYSNIKDMLNNMNVDL